jgi:hypothetical protein
LKIVSFLLAKRISVGPDGLTTFYDSGMDTIAAKSLPAMLSVIIHARCALDPTDNPGTYIANLSFIGDDVILKTDKIPFTITGEKQNINLNIKFDFMLTKCGNYRFQMSIDQHETTACWPLCIIPH